MRSILSMIWHPEGNVSDWVISSGKSTYRYGKHQKTYRVFIEYCVFFLKILLFFWTLPVLLQRWFLPVWCVYTHWHRGKTEKGHSSEYLKIFEKTQYLVNTLYIILPYWTQQHRFWFGSDQFWQGLNILKWFGINLFN